MAVGTVVRDLSNITSALFTPVSNEGTRKSNSYTDIWAWADGPRISNMRREEEKAIVRCISGLGLMGPRFLT